MADEENHDMRRGEVPIDESLPLHAGWNLAIVPYLNQVLAIAGDQLAATEIDEILVFVRVREEDFDARLSRCCHVGRQIVPERRAPSALSPFCLLPSPSSLPTSSS